MSSPSGQEEIAAQRAAARAKLTSQRQLTGVVLGAAVVILLVGLYGFFRTSHTWLFAVAGFAVVISGTVLLYGPGLYRLTGEGLALLDGAPTACLADVGPLSRQSGRRLRDARRVGIALYSRRTGRLVGAVQSYNPHWSEVTDPSVVMVWGSPKVRGMPERKGSLQGDQVVVILSAGHGVVTVSRCLREESVTWVANAGKKPVKASS